MSRKRSPKHPKVAVRRTSRNMKETSSASKVDSSCQTEHMERSGPRPAERHYVLVVSVEEYSDSDLDHEALSLLHSITNQFVCRLMSEGDSIARLKGRIIIQPQENVTLMKLELPGDVITVDHTFNAS